MSPQVLSIVYGLMSAVIWGAGDFSGGMAAKRTNVYMVVIVAQIFGGLGLMMVALVFQEPIPSMNEMLFGGFAGIAGAIGLLALYRGLATGKMGLVAPVAAVVTGIVPIAAAFLLEGLPSQLQLLGFMLALIAVWLMSQTGAQENVRLQDFAYPVLAGFGFGFFFILIDQVETAVLWPLVAARGTAVVLLVIFVIVIGQFEWPQLNQLPIIASAGILDTGGNVFFLLAAQVGRLDIAAVLSSLYPASTVFLAWLILKERLLSQQWVGVLLACVAIVLIAL